MFWVLHGIVLTIMLVSTEYFFRFWEWINPKKFQELENPSQLWLPPEKGVILITGGTAGLGKETAKKLAKYGYRILITSRDEKRGKEAVKEIQEFSRNKRVELRILDLEDLSSVRKFCNKLREENLPIHVLMNNAGGMFPNWKVSKDGMERTFQINHAGHFLLTHLLLDNLKKAQPPGRIIHLGSVGAFWANLDLNNLLKKPLLPFVCYLQSKLSCILFARELQKRLEEEEGRKDIISVSLHPGLISSELYQNMPWIIQFFIGILFQPVLRGSRTQTFLALAPPEKIQKGGFYIDCIPFFLPYNANSKNAKELWEKTAELVSLKK